MNSFNFGLGKNKLQVFKNFKEIPKISPPRALK